MLWKRWLSMAYSSCIRTYLILDSVMIDPMFAHLWTSVPCLFKISMADKKNVCPLQCLLIYEHPFHASPKFRLLIRKMFVHLSIMHINICSMESLVCTLHSAPSVVFDKWSLIAGVDAGMVPALECGIGR